MIPDLAGISPTKKCPLYRFSSFAATAPGSIEWSAGDECRRKEIMAIGHLAERVEIAEKVGRAQAGEMVSDVELLDRFLYQADQAAFATLVQRYGPMVLGVCRRVLRHTQDAEDAFQATFLVLVRKAATLTDPRLLASWLYGVAYRTAQHARARGLHRSQHEREAASMSAATSDPSPDHELPELLDEELSQLPDCYRVPLVLCYMQGMTHQEAARVLGWPAGSMSFRLARAREMLRERLDHRMRTMPLATSGGFARVLAGAAPAEPVPPSLADATVTSAEGIAGGGTVGDVVPPSVGELVEASLRSLRPAPRPWALAAPFLLLLGMGAAAMTWRPPTVGPVSAPAGTSTTWQQPGCHPPPTP
jgi:RNA polymerase sigma-70 factor (ECF subfamily)